jgi:hypothetical protein
MSTSFTQVFGGTTIYPSDVSYLALALTSNIALEWPLEATTGNNIVARIIDITPTGIYTITMPDATQVSVGQTVLFNNLGPNVVTVNNAVGNAILSMNAGEQWQAYLIDNTTVGGVWRTFRYGAAVAQAQAAALAGAGLIADGSELAQNYEVIDFSITPYSLTAPDRAKVFVWGGGLGTLNLPTAVAAGDGWFVQVRNGGQGDLTIDPSGTELINAASTLRLQPGDSAVVVSDGVQWYTIGLGQQAVFAFDYTTIAVTGGTYTLSGSELNRIAYKFTGTLTSNANIVVPATVQQYWVNNATTGSFTLGVKTASGAATLVAQGATAILYCDGTDIISATTSSPFAGVLPVAQGGTGAVNAASALTNLGGTGIGTSVFTAATTAAARSAIAAAAAGANSDITSITGLTTALTVAQGGTGSTTAAGARSNLSAAASGSNADITALTNAAGIQIGAPTLGAQGVGTINATGLFINGVGVGTGSGSVTSVGLSAPAFLSVAGSPVTTSGTLALTLSGTALPVANGGTGQTTYTDGQLLIGNTTGNTLSKATLTAGSGISITNGSGSITITSTAGAGTVTSVSGSGGTTGLTLTGGPITTTGTLTIGGTLAVANGGTGGATASGARLGIGAAASGTNSDITSITGLTTPLSTAQGGTGLASYSVGDIIFASGTTTLSGLADVATGNVLLSGGVGVAPAYGKVGLTTHVNGVLPVANGGTGEGTYTDGQLLIGNSTGNTLAKATLTAGTGITVTNGAGSITVVNSLPLTNFTPAISTTAPNDTVSAASLTASGAATNIDAVLAPKGTGAVLAEVPDSATAGGNKRGANAVDWQTARAAADRVASGQQSVIGGGSNNTASGALSTVAGGLSGVASNTSATVGGGQSNTASGTFTTVVGGANNTASLQGATVIGGRFNVSDGLSSIVGGEYATARGIRGARVHAAGGAWSGGANVLGTAQTGTYVLRRETTNATTSNLSTNGSSPTQASEIVTLPDNATYTFDILVTARRTDAANESAGYRLVGVVDRQSGAATTALVGTVTKTVIAEDTAAWDVDVYVDTTLGGFSVQATGEAAKTIRWVAVVNTAEVMNG